MVRFLTLMCLLSLGYAVLLRSSVRMVVAKGPRVETTRSGIFPRGLVAASMAAAVMQFGEPIAAMAEGSTTSVLESSIERLESGSNRKEVIQALADVFEAAESKTLLVRTKYKYRVINAINNKHAQLANEWDQPLAFESGELKRRVDPYRTVDLKGYLQVAPFVGGAAYLAALFVQQSLPELFFIAYPVAVLAFVSPAIFILLTT